MEKRRVYEKSQRQAQVETKVENNDRKNVLRVTPQEGIGEHTKNRPGDNEK